MAQKPGHSRSESAEELAIGALAWLAGQPDALTRFLALSGLEPGSLRHAAASPGFLGGVLDFIVGDEALLILYASEANVKPAQIVTARTVLNGDDQFHD